MYKIIVRNDKGTGQAIFYDPKTSKMNWYMGSPITKERRMDIELNEEVYNFISSLKSKRSVESLPNYSHFKEECHHCPVIQLCKGIPHSDNWSDQCKTAYVKHMSNLYWAVFVLTGQKLESIEGDTRRPE